MKEILKRWIDTLKLVNDLRPKLIPATVLFCIFQAIEPYVLVFFSARIINELSADRNPIALRHLVIQTLIVTGIVSLFKYILQRRQEAEEEIYWNVKDQIISKKLLRMKYSVKELQPTKDLQDQILQNEGWGGFGLGMAVSCLTKILTAVFGIVSAAVLLVSLFQYKSTSNILNHPIWIIVIPMMIIVFSLASGKIDTYVQHLLAELASKARFGNRVFSYFGVLGVDGKEKEDIRMYDQSKIANVYFRSGLKDSFGVEGPFAKLERGKGGILSGFSSALSAVLTGLLYLFICLKALYHAYSIGSISQYTGACAALAGNLTSLFTGIGELENNDMFLKQIFDFLALPDEENSKLNEQKNNIDEESDINEITFHHVSFTYPETDRKVLDDISVRLEKGKKIAVVGENGSGKTTFIKVLTGLYDPDEGEILINQMNRNDISYKHLFAVVFQDYQLLSQPLGNNVSAGNTYDPEKVKNALSDAGVNELKDQLDTYLFSDYGEKGIGLSGGQSQKTAIARALYQDAPYLILDEPTASLDPIAEAEIYEQLNAIVRNRTVLFISHRLSSCRFCDEILVFDEGRIVEQGSHEELLEKNGKYAELWNAQAQYYAS